MVALGGMVVPLHPRRVNFPLPKSSIGGRIGFELSRLVEAVNSLRPISTDDEFVSTTSLGTKRVKIRRKQSGAMFEVERLTLVTESAQYLFCERVTDNTETFYVAKPEGFYTTDAVGGGSTYVAYPDYSTTTSLAVGNLDAAAGYRQITFPVSPTPVIRHQRITPAYLASHSVIYAVRLAEPLVLGAATCTHIDLNIGDVRRWETLGPVDASNDAPVTFI